MCSGWKAISLLHHHSNSIDIFPIKKYSTLEKTSSYSVYAYGLGLEIKIRSIMFGLFYIYGTDHCHIDVKTSVKSVQIIKSLYLDKIYNCSMLLWSY